jgi:flagella basal body P-ring formation protein FlgA
MSRTVALWVSVALLLGVALGAIPTFLIFHGSRSSSTEPGTVLVAKRLIPKGTSGSSIAAQNLFVVVTIPKEQIAPRGISDPAVLQGRVAAGDIYPNEQLAMSHFTMSH